jgi:hypothetical protein
MTVLAKFVRVERQREPATDVVSERDRAQQRGAVAPLALGHCQRGRTMPHPGCVSDGAWESSVSSACPSMPLASAAFRGGGHEPAADHAGLLRAAEGFHVRDRFAPGSRRDPETIAARVEQVVLGLLGNRLGQRLAQRGGDIRAQLLHDGEIGGRGFLFHGIVRLCIVFRSDTAGINARLRPPRGDLSSVRQRGNAQQERISLRFAASPSMPSVKPRNFSPGRRRSSAGQGASGMLDVQAHGFAS